MTSRFINETLSRLDSVFRDHEIITGTLLEDVKRAIALLAKNLDRDGYIDKARRVRAFSSTIRGKMSIKQFREFETIVVKED